MIPINPYHNYAYILIQPSYPHSSFRLPLTPLAFTPTKEDIDPCVKLEEDDSKRSALEDPLLPSSSKKEQQQAAAQGSEGSSGGGSMKVFKKDRKCPAHGCNKLYSSRIAQRAHIRK